MLGIQVFNLPNDYKFFKDECLEFNHRWLTETLGVDPDEITYIEDVWAGGGNLGPSIEYFIRGLEVGNMVFMQYKTFHDGSREELAVKVIDTGIGLERVAWLYNGSYTSYSDTFAHALSVLNGKINVNIDAELWNKYGPYSCTLNIDEVDDIEKTWAELAEKINEPVDKVKQSI
jgi:alanyl-tRNA synthetase